MQTILGANGMIGEELARILKKRYTNDIRLVSRTPKKINPSDDLQPADLLHPDQASNAIKGSEIVYFTVGLPLNTAVWERDFPVILKNVLDACIRHQARFVYFDNTYMYPMTSELLTEETAFSPAGRKGKVRASMAEMVLTAIDQQRLTAMICRAPEFYGPGKTASFTNTLIFEAIRKKKKLRVPLSDATLRTLIYTPDASAAVALLANAGDTWNQTWHLPCDDDRRTYKQLIGLCGQLFHRYFSYRVVPAWQWKIAGMFKSEAKEMEELLLRYAHDNLFDSSKFKNRFPTFEVTDLREGINEIRSDIPGEAETDRLLQQLSGM